MLSSFLLLVFLPPCLGCQTSSFTECQKVPFVPGHNLVGEGFDVVKLQTSGALVINMKDYMVGGAQGNCTVCYNRLLNQVPPPPEALSAISVVLLLFLLTHKEMLSSSHRPRSCPFQCSTGASRSAHSHVLFMQTAYVNY